MRVLRRNLQDNKSEPTGMPRRVLFGCRIEGMPAFSMGGNDGCGRFVAQFEYVTACRAETMLASCRTGRVGPFDGLGLIHFHSVVRLGKGWNLA